MGESKWMFAPRRGGRLARPPGVARCARFAAHPTDALLAEQQGGRAPRAQPVPGVLALWSDGDAAPRVSGAHGYRVEEVLHWDAPRARERDGREQPDACVAFYFVRRRPGLSAEAFSRHYRERHAELARVHHPGIHRYVQNFVRASTPGAPAWDAIAQLHFAGEDDFRRRFYRDADSPAVIAADVERFVDLASGLVLLTREAGGGGEAA